MIYFFYHYGKEKIGGQITSQILELQDICFIMCIT